MAPAPAGAQIVRNLAHDRIEQGIEDEGDGDRKPDQLSRQMQHEVVERKQDGLKTVVLDAIGDRAETVEQLGRGRVGHSSSSRGRGRQRPVANLG